MYLNDYCCILLHSILKYRQKGSDSMTTVSLRFDDEMKKQLDEMCDEKSTAGPSDSLRGDSPLRPLLLRFQHGAVTKSEPTDT